MAAIAQHDMDMHRISTVVKPFHQISNHGHVRTLASDVNPSGFQTNDFLPYYMQQAAQYTPRMPPAYSSTQLSPWHTLHHRKQQRCQQPCNCMPCGDRHVHKEHGSNTKAAHLISSNGIDTGQLSAR
mmetsp:Transcript_26542/g.57898  ORF Transcript_26542/g.57898 Transcript_26542/m.57898 type:complete len:127 (-) Transcript_26542:124-504(-)